jgi:hypothetical protein
MLRASLNSPTDKIFHAFVLKENGHEIWHEEGKEPGFIRLRIETNEGSCEHGNEPSGSIKCWEVLE